MFHGCSCQGPEQHSLYYYTFPGFSNSADHRGARALLAGRSVTGKWPAPSGSGPGPGHGDGAWPLAEPDCDRAAAWDALWADYEHARAAITRHYYRATPTPP